MRGSVKVAPATKKIREKAGTDMLREEGHVLSKNVRCTSTLYQERDGEEERKAGGTTRVNV